jgi:hypothetical protein
MTNETEPEKNLHDDETAPGQEVLKDEQGRPLVENINAQAAQAAAAADAEAASQTERPVEGADNISDHKEDLREDLKADSLGGATQTPDPDEDANASG